MKARFGEITFAAAEGRGPVLLRGGANPRVGTVVLVYRRDLDNTSTESAG